MRQMNRISAAGLVVVSGWAMSACSTMGSRQPLPSRQALNVQADVERDAAGSQVAVQEQSIAAAFAETTSAPVAGVMGARMPQQAVPVANAESPELPVQVADARVTASAVREQAMVLIEQLSRDENAQVRGQAVEAAAMSPQRMRDVIEAGLKDDNAGVRSIALMAVGKHQLRDLRPMAERLISDGNNHVRASAIYATLRTGGRTDQSPLAEMLFNDANPMVSRHVAFLLGEIGNKSAVPLLRSAALDRSKQLPPDQQPIFQLMVTEALVKLGEQKEVAAIRAALYPSQPGEMEAMALAVQMLGEMKDRQSQAQLMNLANYRDNQGQQYPAEVRLGIALSLARMGVTGSEAVSIADQFAKDANAALRSQSAFVYGAQGQAALDKLAVMMKDPNPQVRISAAASVMRNR
jgi:HEAT repeat protein